MREIKAAAIKLFAARKERDAAKKALKEFRESNGSCEADFEEYGPSSCYVRTPDQNEWCGVCLASQPFWERRHKAGNRVATAMRRLMFLCSKAEVQP